MCSEADRHPTWAPNNNFPVSPSRRQFERGQSGNAQPCAAQLPPRSSLTRVEVESKEWARGGGVGKRDEHLLHPVEQVNQPVEVFRCKFSQSAMLGDQVSPDATRDEQHEKVHVDEEPGLGPKVIEKQSGRDP